MKCPASSPFKILVVLGPTASGKTRLGVKLAQKFAGEIISADSRQVYCGMDIGTGKDLEEYGDIPYHLIDIAMPGDEFNLFKFQRRFLETIAVIQELDHLPILVGGTGMYLEAAVKGYRLVEVPQNTILRQELADLPLETLAERLRKVSARLHNTTDLLERTRLTRAIEIAEYGRFHEPELLPEPKTLILGIRWDRDTLRQRITTRLKERLTQGMIEEVERLNNNGIAWETLESYGLEYRYVALYLKGELRWNDMFQKLNSSIHAFAKRQETWFRHMERNGIVIHWLDGAGNTFEEALGIIENTRFITRAQVYHVNS